MQCLTYSISLGHKYGKSACSRTQLMISHVHLSRSHTIDCGLRFETRVHVRMHKLENGVLATDSNQEEL